MKFWLLGKIQFIAWLLEQKNFFPWNQFYEIQCKLIKKFTFSVLIFGKTQVARLRYLTTAFKYRSRAQVGYVKVDAPDSVNVLQKYEIPSDADSLLLFQENTRIPVVRISMQVKCWKS